MSPVESTKNVIPDGSKNFEEMNPDSSHPLDFNFDYVDNDDLSPSTYDNFSHWLNMFLIYVMHIGI